VQAHIGKHLSGQGAHSKGVPAFWLAAQEPNKAMSFRTPFNDTGVITNVPLMKALDNLRVF